MFQFPRFPSRLLNHRFVFFSKIFFSAFFNIIWDYRKIISHKQKIGLALTPNLFSVEGIFIIEGLKQCFKEGTLVACLNENGEEIKKPIESIAVGTLVLAYDEESGKKAYKPVLQLFRNTTKEWYHVHVNGEEIICTGGHPFYVLNKYVGSI